MLAGLLTAACGMPQSSTPQKLDVWLVKVFPAGSVGGPAHIRALASVLPDVAFCPTGGVEPGNLAAYLAAGAAFVGMGGALVDMKLIAAGDRTTIQASAREVLGGQVQR